MARYIFVAGGVMSGIGKGIATASIGRILKSKGFKVTAIKIDPYINVDAGTMNPVEHGEVFVTDDGTECDQDVGNYERFLDENIYTDNYLTTGRVYQSVINRERNLEYGGRCVEVVPDIPNEVIATIQRAGKKVKADFILIEIGGTVGEYQNMLFLEAARMIKIAHPKDVLFILVSYMPIPEMIGEMKTKPTQYAVRTLNSAGIQPDMILARSVTPLDEPRKRKLSNFCNVEIQDIISAPDVKSIYEVPINFEKENIGNRILKKFGIKARASDLEEWKKLVKMIQNSPEPVEIGIVGKYFESGHFTLTDSYISVIEAVKHAAFFFHRKAKMTWLSSENFEKNLESLKELKKFDGIIIPGGFGNRGIEGKIMAIEYCRKNKIPFLGLCLGMQLSVIEFARNACGLKDATSTEFKKPSKNIVIDVMPEQKVLLKEKKYGGTMRLGAYNCKLKPGTISYKAYGGSNISERHRHRYELNNEYREILEKNGMLMAGVNPEKNLVEIIEIPNHPFFVASQFHPEFKSRPLRPHPLFREFIKTCLRKQAPIKRRNQR
ncbi:MAG: CTP synthase [Candidatus Staskawiczbacteria bacterium RIFCSPHIGHO2_01_FULL_36_16]|uniref:CTP synthase n=1 Tax=Candidatus Staskawiczbacteria bacterium RIFCSPHIGHO2_01_FULL_36_16 TaxID=1802200 RepID=A0A1G2HRK3_9BACT|nr:MAG: CTP synthase [Candidatus Staskawiczbacteria bacterium RIFCSPHIGHO2_01_FULL_36_16]